MKKGLVTTVKIIGLVLAVIGIGFAVWGFQFFVSIASEVTQAVTDADIDKVMIYYVVGTASFVLGIFLFSKS